MSEFFQEGPKLQDPWRNDPALQSCLERLLSEPVRERMTPALERLGALAAGEMQLLSESAESHPPLLVQFDPWGRRIDSVETDEAWEELLAIAAREGVVSTAFERDFGAESRVAQMALLYLYHPSSALASCPLAMTDGAARVMETQAPERLRKRLLPRLISRDPATFWRAGQWMTERSGGSDVARTDTVAERDELGWKLSGNKWFTSAIGGQVALLLARPEGAPAGNRGLALFCLEVRDDNGRLNGIRIDRLKDKLGTRALPTAEITLDGARAEMIGEVGAGVPNIATVLNLTRLYNSCCSAAAMRRAVQLAGDYAQRREAFRRPLIELPLHATTLAELQALTVAATQLVFQVAALTGKEEVGSFEGDEQLLLRLLIPLTKLWTGKLAVAVTSEALECIGGAAYIETTGLPRLLRDAQVFPIWEGTTNVLALDALRVLTREDAFTPWRRDLGARLESLEGEGISASRERLERHLGELEAWWRRAASASKEDVQTQVRNLAMTMAATTAAVLLGEQSAWEMKRGGPSPTLPLLRIFVARHLPRLPDEPSAGGELIRSLPREWTETHDAPSPVG